MKVNDVIESLNHLLMYLYNRILVFDSELENEKSKSQVRIFWTSQSQSQN